MSTRWEAFGKPAPAGWIPRVGEWVFTKSGLSAQALVLIVNKGFIQVRHNYGSKAWKMIYRIDELRPTGRKVGDA